MIKNKNYYTSNFFGLLFGFFCLFGLVCDVGFGFQAIQESGSGNGFLKMTIFSPYDEVLLSKSKRFNTGLGITSNENVLLYYREISQAYGSVNPKDVYCVVGGEYDIKTELHIGVPNIDIKNQYPLFYCQTTKDLISEMKVPSNWLGDNLLVYCNDGIKSGLYMDSDTRKAINYDFFHRDFDVYKLCTVKNLDLTKDNTIIYGLEVGNRVVDKFVDVFNFSTKKGVLTGELTGFSSKGNQVTLAMESVLNGSPIVAVSNFTGKTFHKFLVKDDNEREYDFYYEPESSLFALSDSGLNLNANLNGYLGGNDIGLSRVLLMKKDVNGKLILGYENAGVENSLNTRMPVYHIKYQNSKLKDSCLEHLGKYDAYLPVGAISNADQIRCLDNEIEINADAFKSSKEAFNVFKNIIFSLE